MSAPAHAEYAELIALACERNCPECGRKIDRIAPPDGYEGDPDGECNAREDQCWPTWTHHAPTCPLRVTAQEMGLP